MPQYDEDWYRVDVPHHGELDVAINGVPANLAIHARLWNSNKDTVSDWISPLAAGGDTIRSIDLPSAGSYYLEVGDTNNGRSIQPYTLTISYTAALDPYDSNDTFGLADNLTLGNRLSAISCHAATRIRHRIDLDHQGQVQITASDVPSNLDINFRVWNSEKDTISDWFHPLAQGGNTNGIVDVPEAGAYYIEVADGSGDARSIKPFRLQALFLPAPIRKNPTTTREVQRRQNWIAPSPPIFCRPMIAIFTGLK